MRNNTDIEGEINTMATDEEITGNCNAEGAKGYCERPAGMGTDHEGTGRCYQHTKPAPKGMNKRNNHAVGNNGGPPEGNSNAVKHGATADPWNLYENMPESKRNWINDLTGKYVTRLGWSNEDPRIEIVKRACIHIYQSNAAEAEMGGQTGQMNPAMLDANGEVVMKREEHYLNDVILKRDRMARQLLKSVDALNPSKDQAAGMTQGIASVFEELDERAQEGDDDTITVN